MKIVHYYSKLFTGVLKHHQHLAQEGCTAGYTQEDGPPDKKLKEELSYVGIDSDELDRAALARKFSFDEAQLVFWNET